MTATGWEGEIGTNPDFQHTLDVGWNDLLTMAKFALAARRNGGALPLTERRLATIFPKEFRHPEKPLSELDSLSKKQSLMPPDQHISILYSGMGGISPPGSETLGNRAKAVQNTLATLGFGLALQTGIRGPVGSRLVLLTPDADPAAARIAMEAKPDNWDILIEPKPTPPMLEALAAEIETRDRAWLEANKAECDAAGVEFDPEIKRISASDYRAADQSGGGAAILPAIPPALERRDEAIEPPQQQPPLPGASWIEPKAITTPTLPTRPAEPEWLYLPRERTLFADVGGLPADGEPERVHLPTAVAYTETGGPLPSYLAGAFNAIVRHRLMDHDAAAREAGAGSRSHLSNARHEKYGLSPEKARNLVAWIAKHCGHEMPPASPPPDERMTPPNDRQWKGTPDNGDSKRARLPARPPSNENGPSNTIGGQRIA